MAYDYSIEDYKKEQMARAYGLVPISLKKSVEVCNFIRNKNLARAKKLLEEVISMDTAVPFRRYVRGIPHRKGGIGPGKYPIKASGFILKLINSAEANAQFKGLKTSNLIIKQVSAKKAPTAMHTGRQRARKMKRCYVEVVVSESK